MEVQNLSKPKEKPNLICKPTDPPPTGHAYELNEFTNEISTIIDIMQKLKK